MAGKNLGSVYYTVDADVSAMLKAEAQIDKSISGAVASFDRADKAVKEFIATQNKLGRELNGAGQIIDKNGDAVADASIQYRKLAAEAEKLKTTTLQQTQSFKAVRSGLSGIGRGAGQAGIQLQQFIGQIQGGQAPMLALSQQSADLGFVLGAPLVGAIVGISSSIAGLLLPELFKSSDAIEDVEKAVENLRASMTLSADFVANYSEEMRQLKNISEALFKIKLATLIAEQEAAFKKAADGVSQSISGLRGSFDTFNDVIKDTFGSISREAISAFTDLNMAATSLKIAPTVENINKLQGALSRATEAGINNTEQGRNLSNQLTTLIAQYKLGEITLEKFNKALEGSNEGLGDASASVEKYSGLAKRLEIRSIELESASLAREKALTLEQAAIDGVNDSTIESISTSYDKLIATAKQNEQERESARLLREKAKAQREETEAQRERDKLEKERNRGLKASDASALSVEEGATSFALGIIGDTQSTEEILQQQRELLDDYYALDLITAKQHANALKSIDKQVADNKIKQQSMILGASSEFFGASADLVSAFAGETSGAYKVLFAISKGFAIANAALQLQTAIANAAALPWPANIPAIASAVATGASLASNIAGITYDGGRLYGGSTAPNSLYKVTEDGRPEMFSDGRDSFLMTGSRGGSVTSNGDLGASSEPQWNIIVNNNAPNSRATAEVDDQTKTVKIAISEVGRQFREHYGEAYQGLIAGTNTTGRAT